MEGMEWPEIDLEARVADLVGRHVAVTGVGPDAKPALVLVTFGGARNGEVRARIGDTSTREPMPIPQAVTCAGSVSLAAFVLAHTAVRARGAAEPPRIKWPISGSLAALPMLVGALVLVILLAVLLSQPTLLFVAVPLLVGGVWKRGQNQALLPPAVVEKSWQLLPSQVMAKTPLADGIAGPTPQDRVDVVKAAYGRLLSDIVYRIENSALFDAAHPATSRFEIALLSWDPASTDAAKQVHEIEDSFTAARREAERLGLEHLPLTARGSARRAAKAATTALSDAPEAERVAALARVEEILTSLALYYLPTVDRSAPSLIGGRRAIEPSA